jgi:hypothetical protein
MRGTAPPRVAHKFTSIKVLRWPARKAPAPLHRNMFNIR